MHVSTIQHITVRSCHRFLAHPIHFQPTTDMSTIFLLLMLLYRLGQGQQLTETALQPVATNLIMHPPDINTVRRYAQTAQSTTRVTVIYTVHEQQERIHTSPDRRESITSKASLSAIPTVNPMQAPNGLYFYGNRSTTVAHTSWEGVLGNRSLPATVTGGHGLITTGTGQEQSRPHPLATTASLSPSGSWSNATSHNGSYTKSSPRPAVATGGTKALTLSGLSLPLSVRFLTIVFFRWGV